MGFIKGRCEVCKGELQLPDDREYVICMYCGAQVAVKEAADESEDSRQEEMAKEVRQQNYNRNLSFALTEFPSMITNMQEPMQHFRKKLYEGAFQKVQEEYKEVLDAIGHAYMLAEEPDELIQALARAIVGEGAAYIRAEKSKRKQEERLTELNMALIVYVLPVILESRGAYAEELTDQILACWREEFPKTSLKKATFEQINGGFRNKLCYITTTLCEGLGKADDCYELNLLRDYRDNWLASEPGGEELIEEYYDIAPTIVKRMKRQPDAEQVYQRIYKTYLEPCMEQIERDNREACRDTYVRMVDDLKRTYITGYDPS